MRKSNEIELSKGAEGASSDGIVVDNDPKTSVIRNDSSCSDESSVEDEESGDSCGGIEKTFNTVLIPSLSEINVYTMTTTKQPRQKKSVKISIDHTTARHDGDGGGGGKKFSFKKFSEQQRKQSRLVLIDESDPTTSSETVRPSSRLHRFVHYSLEFCCARVACCFCCCNCVNVAGWRCMNGDRRFGGVRYVILVVAILCMAATRSNEVSFNFTVICMTSNATVNGDEPIEMNTRHVSILFASGGIGAIAMVFPVVYAIHYIGARAVFASLLMVSALGTAALPTMGRWSPMWMVPPRIIQGLALSAVLPLMGCISAQWAPLAEVGKFMTLLSSANQLSQIVTMPLSARLCVTSGWSSVYYFHGLASAVFAILFFVVFRRTPRTHPCVNKKELHFITKGARKRSKHEKIPYMEILKTKSVWAIWIAFLGNSFGFQLIVQFMPTFLNKVLDFPISKTGFAAIIPPLAQLFVKVIAGWLCDRITCISELRKIQIFNSISMIGCGLFFLPLGFLPQISADVSAQQLVALLCFTSGISCLGMVACGSMKSATLVARDFSHFVMAAVQILVCVGMLLIPMLVSRLAPNNTIAEWRSVFFVVFFVLVLCDIFFCKFCGSEPEPWAVKISKYSVESNYRSHSTTNKSSVVVPGNRSNSVSGDRARTDTKKSIILEENVSPLIETIHVKGGK